MFSDAFDTTKTWTVVWDYDSILFPATTILQNDYIIVRHNGLKSPIEFKNITSFRGRSTKKKEGCEGSWLYDLNMDRESVGKAALLTDDFRISKESRVIADDSAAKRFINNSIERLLLFPWVSNNNLKLVIEGNGNYRNKVAFTSEYKSGRGKKPMRFSHIRSWFIDKYRSNVITAEGCETDDIVNIFGHRGLLKGNNVVRVGIDKDHFQTPGWFYNNNEFGIKDVPTYIEPDEAIFNLHCQHLTGDSVDKIPGIPNMGKVKSSNILNECANEKEMMESVICEYKRAYGDGYVKVLREQFCLIKLLERRLEQYEHVFLSYDEYYFKVFGTEFKYRVDNETKTK